MFVIFLLLLLTNIRRIDNCEFIVTRRNTELTGYFLLVLLCIILLSRGFLRYIRRETDTYSLYYVTLACILTYFMILLTRKIVVTTDYLANGVETFRAWLTSLHYLNGLGVLVVVILALVLCGLFTDFRDILVIAGQNLHEAIIVIQSSVSTTTNDVRELSRQIQDSTLSLNKNLLELHKLAIEKVIVPCKQQFRLSAQVFSRAQEILQQVNKDKVQVKEAVLALLTNIPFVLRDTKITVTQDLIKPLAKQLAELEAAKLFFVETIVNPLRSYLNENFDLTLKKVFWKIGQAAMIANLTRRLLIRLTPNLYEDIYQESCANNIFVFLTLCSFYTFVMFTILNLKAITPTTRDRLVRFFAICSTMEFVYYLYESSDNTPKLVFLVFSRYWQLILDFIKRFK